MKRVLLFTALALAILYIGDYLLLRNKIKTNHAAFGSVQVESFSEVPEKNNKVEFFYNDPETIDCVHALFPHLNDPPCWYVNRSKIKQTDL